MREHQRQFGGSNCLQAVILAGGQGTRLRPLTDKVTKSMISISGKPFIEYEIALLKRNAVDDLVICTGYGGAAIQRYFGDGTAFGVRINYSDDGEQLLGTAGSLKKAKPLLSQCFFLTFGDAYPILDYPVTYQHFLSTNKTAMMVVNKNMSKYGRSNTIVQNGLVTYYSKSEKRRGMDYIEFGVTYMKKHAVDLVPDTAPVDLGILYRQIIARNEMAAFEVDQRIYDIGSPQGLGEFRNLVEQQKLPL
jgi:NDP-sugar pyrophosphorylase family protein